MIISASRRTDIPAFYNEWFMNRLRAGYVLVANPFNRRQVRRVSLAAEDVTAIFLWTRNAEPLMPYLSEIDAYGHLFLFHYTITGYPAVLERATPGLDQAIDTFSRLSDLLGADRLVWRYDPILISNVSSLHWHIQNFATIAAALEGKSQRVTISFAELYRKTRTSLKSASGLICYDIFENQTRARKLVRNLADIAAAHGMTMQSCAVDMDLGNAGVTQGKCFDEERLKASFGIDYPSRKDTGQRALCNCVKSIDIGQYNTCLHGCLYCYATSDPGQASKNHNRHDPASPILVGPVPLSAAAAPGPRQYRLF